MFETWVRISAAELNSKSYMVKGGDTVVFETIKLLQEQAGLFYIPTARNQNKGLPIRFALKTFTKKSLLFENLQHDFPQFISYKKINADSLLAEISGVKNGQRTQHIFEMKRVM